MKQQEEARLIKNKDLHVNLLKLIYQETYSVERARVVGGVLCAIAANAFSFILNAGASDILAKRLNIGEDYQTLWKVFIVLNGVITTTATNLYAAGGTFKSAIDLKRRLAIVPDYKTWFNRVMIGASIIGAFGVAGPVALVYDGYKNNIAGAVIFTTLYGLINLCNVVFFVFMLTNMARSAFLKNAQASDSNKLHYIQEVILHFSENAQHLSNSEFIALQQTLKNFYEDENPSHEQIHQALLALASKLHHSDDASIRHEDGDRSESKSQTHDQTPPQYYLPSLYPTITSAWLFYLVGSGAIKLLTPRSEFFDTLAGIVGVCTSFVTLASILFSALALTDKFRKKISTGNWTPSSAGKDFALLISSVFSSLGYLTLVDNFFSSDSSSVTHFMEASAVIQCFCMVMNAMMETKFPTINNIKNIGLQFFGRAPVEAQKKNFADNLKDLSHNLSSGSSRDIDRLYSLFTSNGFIDPSNCTPLLPSPHADAALDDLSYTKR